MHIGNVQKVCPSSTNQSALPKSSKVGRQLMHCGPVVYYFVIRRNGTFFLEVLLFDPFQTEVDVLLFLWSFFFPWRIVISALFTASKIWRHLVAMNTIGKNVVMLSQCTISYLQAQHNTFFNIFYSPIHLGTRISQSPSRVWTKSIKQRPAVQRQTMEVSYTPHVWTVYIGLHHRYFDLYLRKKRHFFITVDPSTLN